MLTYGRLSTAEGMLPSVFVYETTWPLLAAAIVARKRPLMLSTTAYSMCLRVAACGFRLVL